MKELLARWHDIEPDKCRSHKSIIGATLYTFGSHCDSGENMTALALRDLQGAVQEAIEAKGWSAQIKINIRHPKMKRWARHQAKINNEYIKTSDESPTHALLEAYLEALKQAQSEEV